MAMVHAAQGMVRQRSAFLDDATRRTRKEKTLYWLHVFEGCFDVAVWFREKNRAELLAADVSSKIRRLICAAETFGKVLTFPLVIDVTTEESLADIYALIELKKKLEK